MYGANEILDITMCRRCAVLSIKHLPYFASSLQVMESQSMIYIVSEYASQGEIFGKFVISACNI